MGLFRKKADPISERSRALKQEIAALEAQIRELSQRTEAERVADVRDPRLRPASTLRNAPSTPAAQEQPVRKIPVTDFKLESDPLLAPELDLTVDRPGVFARIAEVFRGKPASNPKLVTFLAAGSIQGLRPLRYEKRIARNRFILLSVILLAILWGVLAVFLKNN